MSLFLINEQQAVLENVNIDVQGFPKILPIIEIERIKNIDFWNHGKRVLTEIHRIGRKEGYSSVVTIPIGDEVIGLLVIVSAKNDKFKCSISG